MKPFHEFLNLNSKKEIYNYKIVEKKYYQNYWHYHPELEISFVEKGKGVRSVGDNIAPFQNNDLTILGAYLPHSRESKKRDRNTSIKEHVFHFSIDIIKHISDLKPIIDFLNEAGCGFFYSNPNGELIEKIKQFNSLKAHRKSIVFLEILLNLYEDKNRVKLSSQEYMDNKDFGLKNQRVSAIINLINENIQQELNIDDFAQQFNFSKSYFCRWFKKATGYTFVKYVNQTRVSFVCRKLEQEKAPIAEIAFQAGFQNVSHFNRVFKEIKGCSPRIYLQQNKNT